MKFHGDARFVRNDADGYLSLNSVVNLSGAIGCRSAKVVSRCPSKDGGSALTTKVSVPPGVGFSPPASEAAGEPEVPGLACCAQAPITSVAVTRKTKAIRARSKASTPLTFMRGRCHAASEH